MSNDYHQSAVWQRAMDLAAACYELAESLKGPGANRLAAQVTTAASRLPARVAQAAGTLSSESEGLLLELETLLLLATRLGAAHKSRVDSVLVDIAGLQAYVPAAAEKAVIPSPIAGAPAPSRAEKLETKATTMVPAPVRRPIPVAPPPRTGVDRLVVDGHNFLGRADGFMLGSDASRDQLVLRLQEYAKKHPAHRVTVFFDGNRNSIEEKAGVEIRFCSGDGSADDAMVNFIYGLPEADRKRAQIVTDDRELSDRARNAGVRRQPVSWLEEQVGRKKAASTQPRPESVPKESVAEWEAFFSRPPQRPGR